MTWRNLVVHDQSSACRPELGSVGAVDSGGDGHGVTWEGGREAVTSSGLTCGGEHGDVSRPGVLHVVELGPVVVGPLLSLLVTDLVPRLLPPVGGGEVAD